GGSSQEPSWFPRVGSSRPAVQLDMKRCRTDRGSVDTASTGLALDLVRSLWMPTATNLQPNGLERVANAWYGPDSDLGEMPVYRDDHYIRGLPDTGMAGFTFLISGTTSNRFGSVTSSFDREPLRKQGSECVGSDPQVRRRVDRLSRSGVW